MAEWLGHGVEAWWHGWGHGTGAWYWGLVLGWELIIGLGWELIN